jgi:hypothetical protein
VIGSAHYHPSEATRSPSPSTLTRLDLSHFVGEVYYIPIA